MRNKMMNFEEYATEVKKEIRKRLSAEPINELEKYILILDEKGYIKSSYKEDIDEEIANLTDCPVNPDPSSFAHSIFMLYPDFPNDKIT